MRVLYLSWLFIWLLVTAFQKVLGVLADYWIVDATFALGTLTYLKVIGLGSIDKRKGDKT